MRLVEAAHAHLCSLVADGRSHHTIRNARSALGELVRFLMHLGVGRTEALTLDVLTRYRQFLFTRPTSHGRALAPGSRKEHIGKVRGFCSWLFKQGLVSADLAEGLPGSRRARRLPRVVLTVSEVGRILRQPDLRTQNGCRDRTILELLYSTAVRREEAANLALGDVDAEGGYLAVRDGKNGKDRVVPIGDRTRDFLRHYTTTVRPEWPGAGQTRRLFLTRFGRPMGPPGIWSVVRKHAEQARVRNGVSTHTFRHSCATHMVRAGVPIRHLQELLGHESLETTQIYTHLAIPDLKAAHRRFHPRDRNAAFQDLPNPPR